MRDPIGSAAPRLGALALVALLLPAAGPLSAQGPPEAGADGARPGDVDRLSSAEAAGPADADAVTLLPGDALEVGIWREEELSGEFIVDEEGVVTLPLLGRIQVTGIPVEELERRLLERYAVELRNPSISIRPLRRVYVLGEVNQPGLLGVDPTVTLAGAVAMAGGANLQGDLKKLRVMRDGEMILEDPGPEMDLVTVDIRSGDQIFVERRSWFERNSTFLVSATIGAAGIIVQLLR